MYRHPAFQVSRDQIGYVEGGDYVRGSTVADLPRRRCATPPASEAIAEAAAQRGILYTRPYDYNTIEIFWGIPDKVWDAWAEVAIVRSAFGYPADGQRRPDDLPQLPTRRCSPTTSRDLLLRTHL